MRVLVGIPTRDRPEYLSCLLVSLMFQTHRDFHILIVDTSDDIGALEAHPMFTRFHDTFMGTGITIAVVSVKVAGRSEATAVNRILAEAATGGYDAVYKIDDDHLLPPDGLEKLAQGLEQKQGPAILSGVTPWMHQAFEGAAGPSDKPQGAGSLGEELLTRIEMSDGRVVIEPRHFHRYNCWANHHQPTQLASAANFFMKPDLRILWADTGSSSLGVDAVWFLQLAKFLDYKMYFILDLNVWHMAAPTGGVREEEEHYKKDHASDGDRHLFLTRFCQAMGVADDS